MNLYSVAEFFQPIGSLLQAEVLINSVVSRLLSGVDIDKNRIMISSLRFNIVVLQKQDW